MQNPILIYSARHTGTWFVSGLLHSCNLETLTYPDIWISELTGIQFIESLPIDTTCLNQDWVDQFFSSYVPSFRVEGTELLILQGHHFSNEAPLYQSLIHGKPDLSVIVPIRDPLLALNSRVWRVAGTIDNLRRQGIEERTRRAVRYCDIFANLMAIPREHIFAFPIDVDRVGEENFRAEQTRRMFEFCGLEITNNTIDKIRQWQPVNKTKGGKYHEKYQRRAPTDDFLFSTIKHAVIDNQYEAVHEVLDVEFDYLLTQEDRLRPRLEELGYRNLMWWQ